MRGWAAERSVAASVVPRGEAERVTPYAWLVLLLLALVNAVNYMDRWVMSVLLQPIKLDLHLSDTQMGLLTGLSFSLSYALFALPIARIADRGARRMVLTGAIVTWSIMTGFAGLARNFWQLMLARIGVGAGEAGCIPTGQSLIADYFPPDRRAFALSVFSAGSMLGKVLGIGGAGFLVAAYGWHTTLGLMAIPGLILALVVMLVVRDPGRNSAADSPDHVIPVGMAIRSLLATRSYVLITIALACSNFVIAGVQNWSPAFYMRAHGLTATQVGAAVATVVGVGSAIGLLAGGWLTQHLIQRDRRWAMWAASVFTFIAGSCSVLSFLVSDARLSLLLFAATSIILNLPTGGIFSTQLGIIDPRTRALASAVSLTLASIVGLGLGPLAVGALSDALGSTGDGLRPALILVACLNLIPLLLYAMAGRSLAVDLDRHAPGTPLGAQE